MPSLPTSRTRLRDRHWRNPKVKSTNENFKRKQIVEPKIKVGLSGDVDKSESLIESAPTQKIRSRTRSGTRDSKPSPKSCKIKQLQVPKSTSNTEPTKSESLPVLLCGIPLTLPQTKDKKLRGVAIVAISPGCRKRAEAAMKLRKSPKPAEKQVSDTESEEEPTTEESQSSSDETDEEDSSRTYPLRKKSPLIERKRTPTRAQSAGSASDSSSESLIDIPPPTSGFEQKWIETIAKEKEKPATPAPKSDPAPKPSNSKGVRALRSSSSDGHTFAQESVLYLRSTGATSSGTTTNKSKTPQKIFKSGSGKGGGGGSPRRSPDKEKILSEKHSTPTPTKSPAAAGNQDKSEAEKSYSFRHLEKKRSLSAGDVIKPKPTASTSSVESSAKIPVPNVEPTPRRKPGRPRKVVPPPPVATKIVLDIKEDETAPPAKRTRRSASNEFVAFVPHKTYHKKDKPKESESEKEKRNLHLKRLHDPAKQQRDAIALRARQSKIMAKSRVLQSNKYSFNASWRKPFSDKKSEQDSIDSGPPSLTLEESQTSASPTIEDQSSSSSSGEFSSGSGGDALASTSSPSFFNQVGATDELEESKPTKATKGIPVAKCEICDLTFTRKFSYTKHLATLQHSRMLRRCGGKDAKKQRELLPDGTEVPFKNKGGRPPKKKNIPIAIPIEAPKPTRVEIPSPDEEIEDSENGELEDEDEEPEIHRPPYLTGKLLGPNKFMCEICGDIFAKKVDFGKHLWNHREGSDLVCQDCGVQFTESDKFNEHIDSAHIQDVKLACKFCPSQFSREDYLEKHMQSHKRDLDEKFICSVCDKRFSSHDLLSRHFDIKHLQLGTPKVELSYDTLPPHLQQPLDFAEGDNYFENYDPNSEENRGGEVQEIDLDDDEEGEDDADSRSQASQSYQNNSFLRNGRNPNNVIRRFLHYSWLNDNSMIGCGTVNGGTPHFPYNPLSCKDCGKLFQSRRLLVKHVDYFSHAERYVCQVCKQKFKWRYLLTRHMMRHTRGKEQLKLARAKASRVKRPSFLLNRQQPIVSKLLPISPKAVVSSAGLQFPIFDGPSTSAECSSTFLSKPAVATAKDPLDPETPVISTLPTTFSTSFPSVPTVASPSTATTSDKEATATRKAVFEPMPGQNSKYFSCDVCSKTFTDHKTLDVHTRFHQTENLFSCPDCEAKCERKSDLDLHSKCHETNQPFFLCYVCFKPFRWKKDMVRHIRKKHPEEKTYRCIYCSERFRVNDELNDHISEAHASHRSFPCDYCGRRYAQRRYLQLHIQTRHGIESGLTQEQFVEGEVASEAEPELYLDASSFLQIEQSL